MTRATVLLAICLAFSALTPATANANILRWIDELSGPGDFIGWSLEVRVLCGAPVWLPGKEPTRISVGVKTRCPKQKKEVDFYRYTVSVEGGISWALNNPVKYERDGAVVKGETVMLFPLEAFVYYQPKRGVELGAGAGVFVFDGSQFRAFGMPVIEPVRVDFRPFDMRFDPQDISTGKNWLRMVTLRAGITLIPRGISAVRFGGPAQLNSLNEPYEALYTLGLVFDYGAWRKKVE